MSAREKELVSEIHHQVETLIHKALQSDRKKGAYDPLVHKEGKLKHEAVANIDRYIARLKAALKILADEKVLNEKTISFEELHKLAKSRIAQEIKKGALPYQMYKLSHDNLLDFYRIASSHFERGDYTGASNLFLLLTFLNPVIASFWVGLGMTEEIQENFEPAICAYLFAAEMNKNDLQPILHSARCLNKMKQPERAKELLQLTMEQLKDIPAQQEFKQKAQRLV